MGRTNPTYRDRLRRVQDNWSDYRRALRQRDQASFDALWEDAGQYADAAGYQNPPRTFDAILISMLLAQHTRIQELEDRLSRLEPPEESQPGGD